MSTAQIAIDGYFVEAASFTRSRTAKINTYSIPNSYSDSFLPMSAQILSFKMDIKAYSDEDYENIILLLSKPYNNITDIDGTTYNARTVSINTNHIGGQVGYYDITVDMVEKPIENVGLVVWGTGGLWREALPYITSNSKVIMEISDDGTHTSPALTHLDFVNMLSTNAGMVLDVLCDVEPYYHYPAPLLNGVLYNSTPSSGEAWDSYPVYADVYDATAITYLGASTPTIYDYTIYDSEKVAPFTTWSRFSGYLSEGYAYKILPNTTIIKENPYDGYWYDYATLDAYIHWDFRPQVIWLANNGTDVDHPPPIYGNTKNALQHYANTVGATFIDLTI